MEFLAQSHLEKIIRVLKDTAMASFMIFFITFATFAAFIPSILATEHEVGDVFKYPSTRDPQCAQELMELHFSTVQHELKQNDVVNLTIPGRKWYICGIGKHCVAKNMKLAITVLAEGESPTTSPSPSSGRPTSPAPSSGTSVASRYNGWIVLILGILGWAIS